MKNLRYHIGRIGMFLCLSCFLAMAANAATPVGKVTQAVDSARAGRQIQVSSGEAVFEGDTFIVGPSGSMIILFEDDSVLTLKAGSRATISTFRMGGKGKPGMALIKATDGKYRFTPGKILAQGGVQFVSKDTGSGTAATGQGTLVAQQQSQGSSGQTSTAGSGGTTPAGGTAMIAAAGADLKTDKPGSGSFGGTSQGGPGQSGSLTPGSGSAATAGGFSSSAPAQAGAPSGSWTTMVASAGTPSTPNVAAGTWSGTSNWTNSSTPAGSDSSTSGGTTTMTPGSSFTSGGGGFTAGSSGFSGMQDPCALGGCGNGPSGAPTGGNAIPAPDMLLASLGSIGAISSPTMASFDMNMAGLNFDMAGLNLNMADLGSFNFDQANLGGNLSGNLSRDFGSLNVVGTFNVADSFNVASMGTQFNALNSGVSSAITTFTAFDSVKTVNLVTMNNLRSIDLGGRLQIGAIGF